MGALVLVGFFAHKALTGFAVKYLPASMTTDASGAPTLLATWQKPIVGGVVGALGVAGLSMAKGMKADKRAALGAGLMTSWLQSVVQSALTAMNQPKLLSAIEGYSNSRAYNLRGMRGLGGARNAVSIMPQYAPIGAYTQAAAGMGEYFAAQSGMGEYFAGPGVQGVGHYEKAGPLALQPSRSHMGNLPIDDGIRPDSNLDHVLDLAESAAGLGAGYTQAAAGMGAAFQQAAAGMGRWRGRRGRHPMRGMGEYYSASPGAGGFNEMTVPTQDQWIPNGPLWAGTMSADAPASDSEMAAGVLNGPGGNGVLSG
jgi:hypothetical protein